MGDVMEVFGKYRVRLRSRTIGSGDYTNSSELVEEIGGKEWAWLEKLIDELLELESLPVRHPSGRPWRFMIYVNFYGGKKSKGPTGIRLWSMPRGIRGVYKIRTILLKADQPLTLEGIIAHLRSQLAI